MTHFCKLSAALAAASVVVLSAQAAHAGVPMPPRPTITVPVVRPAIPSVKPHIPTTISNMPVYHCKCGIHPPGPAVNNNHPYPNWSQKPQPVWVKPPVKPPVTVTVTSTSSKPGSFAGQPATLNTTNSNWQGPAGGGTQTTTVITDGSGNVVGAISSAAVNKPAAPVVNVPVAVPVSTPAPATTAPQPAANQPSAPQPGTVPVHSSTPAPAPAANPPAPSHAAAPAASAPAPAANTAPAAAPKKPDVWKPVLYPGFTDQYKTPKGYYVDGKLVMGFKGPSGNTCSPTIGFQPLGGGPVSSTGGAGMVQITAVQCYVKS